MSILRSVYPLLKMDELCRGCKGHPKTFVQRETCPMCKKNHAAWVKLKFDNEITEILYLYRTWIKAKNYVQQTTGVPAIDACIVFLFGFPTKKFGVSKPGKMPAKVAMPSTELSYGPIHLPREKHVYA